MAYTIRPITRDEAAPFFEAQSSSFGRDFHPDRMKMALNLGEFDRSTSVWDGDQVVGTAGIWSFGLTVPGGSLPTAGVTWVSVRPTHRRQGVLTSIMRTQLDNIRERGEALAALWATESVIYGRFGYGLAGEAAEMRIDRTRTALRATVPAPGSTRFVDRDRALLAWPKVYGRVLPVQPGMYTRSPAWWEWRSLPAEERPRPGYTNSFRVQYEEDGEPLGYVRYRIKESSADGLPSSTLAVEELMAATDAAYSALWQFIFGVDLIATIVAEWRRMDEPLTWMLADPRRLFRRVQDALWVRVVDVPKALAGRRYSAPGQLVLDVKDAFCQWNEGRYLLEAGLDGARCTRTDRPAEITLNADDLGVVYLGGVRFQTLAHTGRLCGTPEALKRADAMFTWDPMPWTPEIF
jgi:predicted acetyltransferase